MEKCVKFHSHDLLINHLYKTIIGYIFNFPEISKIHMALNQC